MASSMAVAAVVAFYMSAALIMVFVNKAVLISTPSLPLLFLLLQLLIAVVLLHISALSTSARHFSTRIELPTPTLNVFKSLLPVIFVNVVGLVFNTLCLRDVDASFFQIARGLQLPLTIFVGTVTTKPIVKPSLGVTTAASFVTLGFFVGIVPGTTAAVAASNVPFRSLFYGFLSSLFIAVHAVLIKSSLPYCNNSTIELAWWTNAGSAIFLLPFVILTGELGTLQELLSTRLMNGVVWNPNTFIYGSLVTGFFGFLLCIAGLLSIKVTSPVTHMFSSAARSVLQTLLGVLIFGDIMTVNRAGSILVILGGTMFYTYVKHMEASKQQAKNDQGSVLPKYAEDPAKAPTVMTEDISLEELEKEILGLEGNEVNDKV